MEIVGMVAVALAVAVGLVLLVLLVRSLPDLFRYRRLRRM